MCYDTTKIAIHKDIKKIYYAFRKTIKQKRRHEMSEYQLQIFLLFCWGLLRIWWILYGCVVYWIKHGEEREVWDRKGF